jgi:hypothetical protein
MRMKLPLLIGTATLFVAFPLLAQGGRDGHGRGNHGNNSNHSGHDDDGNSAGHRQDAPHGFGNHNLVLGNQAQIAAVTQAVTRATASLRSGSLTTTAGTTLPAEAQANTYAALTLDPKASAAATKLSATLSTAGPEVSKLVPPLVRSFAALPTSPRLLPTVVANYNDFTAAASPAFIANPPAEFLAMRAVLAQLSVAAAAK